MPIITPIMTSTDDMLTSATNANSQSFAQSLKMAEQNDLPSEDILAQAVAWLKQGKNTALVTVIETWGSSPRPVGSQMLVSSQMEFAGSVSGGCVEGAVIEESIDALHKNQHKIMEFGISDLDAWQYGLACGGKMRALIMPLSPPFADHAILSQILATRQVGDAQILLINLDIGGVEILALYSKPHANLSESARQNLHRARHTDRSLLLDEHYFALNIAPPPLLLIIGAVHIAQELAPFAKRAGFDPIIIDPRRGFATLHRFPNVKLQHEWPAEAIGALRIDHRAALVTMTHDPKLDDPALIAALKLPFFLYRGLGQQKKPNHRG